MEEVPEYMLHEIAELKAQLAKVTAERDELACALKLTGGRIILEAGGKCTLTWAPLKTANAD